MRLYFGGAEVPGWRNILAAAEVPAVSMSFVGLARRIKHLGNWRIADKFPDGQAVFLDSGAYSLNKKDAGYSDEEAYALAEAYAAFVTANIGRIEMFSEFDALQLGPSRLLLRESLRDISPGKFMPIWHSEYGLDELEGLAESNKRVGILRDDAEGDMTATLNSLAQNGVLLHGVAMTKMEAMRAVRWDSVGSTSWLSPTQYGDTFIWTGKELKRYPKAYKDQARKRHRTLIKDTAGLDPDKIAADDAAEVLRLSIWSWTSFVEDINRHRLLTPIVREAIGGVLGVTPPPDSADDGNLEHGPPVVGRRGSATVNEELGSGPRERVLLPVLSVTNAPLKDGDKEGETEPRVGVVDTNLMQCSRCHLAEKCPQFKPGDDCAFDIPVVLRTTTQVRALRKAILAMQGQRVLMMRMIEQLEGGYADQNLSVEIGRLWKMITDEEEAARNRESFEIKVTGSGEAGMVSRIFGSQTADRMAALEAPRPTVDILAGMGIVDAEVIEETVDRHGA